MQKTTYSNKKILLLFICFLILFTFFNQLTSAEEINYNNSTQITKIENTAISPKNIQKYNKLCQKANLMVDKKEYNKALILLENAFNISKELDMANAVTGKIHLFQNLNDNNAMYYAQKALEYNSENYIANYVMGTVYFHKKNYEKALTYYNNTILAKPSFPNPLLDIGIIYCNAKDYNKSINYLTKYISTKPDNENLKIAYLWRIKAYLYDESLTNKALKDVDILISLDPKNPIGYSYKGKIYSNMKNHKKEALKYTDKSIKMSKNNKIFEVYLNKIYVYSKVNPSTFNILSDINIATALAKNDLDKLVSLDNFLNDYNTQYYTISHTYSENLLKELINISQQILDIDPNNKEALNINTHAKNELANLHQPINSKIAQPTLRPTSFKTITAPPPTVSTTNTPTMNVEHKTVLNNMPTKLQTPSWIDTKNPVGEKVYLDANSQFYYGWGAVYTIKYMKDGKPMYTQIELKGLRGNKAAILSVDRDFQNVYNIPITRNYKNINPNQAIYNSTKIVLMNTNKQTCPDTICKLDYGTNISNSATNNYNSKNANTDSNAPDFGPYMRELQRRIKMNWDPPKGIESKRVVLLFKIAKDGRLLYCNVFKSSGILKVDQAAIAAVQTTAPFRPLPAEFKGTSIDIQFTFDYNVFGASGYH